MKVEKERESENENKDEKNLTICYLVWFGSKNSTTTPTNKIK